MTDLPDIAEAVARRQCADEVANLHQLVTFDQMPGYWQDIRKEEAASYIRAYLAEIEARGFKVVPVESDTRMYAAGRDAMNRTTDPDDIYAAMLSAAPAAPGSEPIPAPKVTP